MLYFLCKQGSLAERRFIMADFESIVKEVHMKYYSQGKFGQDRAEIKEICKLTGVSKKEAKDAIERIKHPNGKQWLLEKEIEENKRMDEIRQEKLQKKVLEQQASVLRNMAKCPRCGSTSISYDTKKLSLGRALVGDAIAGRTGAVLGGLSSKKGYGVCLKCGKRWKL